MIRRNDHIGKATTRHPTVIVLRNGNGIDYFVISETVCTPNLERACVYGKVYKLNAMLSKWKSGNKEIHVYDNTGQVVDQIKVIEPFSRIFTSRVQFNFG